MRPYRVTICIMIAMAIGITANAFAAKFEDTITQIPIWKSGEGGYDTYRIPALVVTVDGTVLAFCEGRKDGRGDAGNIDMLLKRSTDGGQTWSEQQVIWDDGPNTCGNPAPVVDRETADIHLLMTWNRGDDHERDIIAGTSTDTRRVYVTRSKDDGATWSEPREITATTKLPNWTWYATEFDGQDIFFGFVKGDFDEFGSFSLSELQRVRGRLGLPVERDLYFQPTPLRELTR